MPFSRETWSSAFSGGQGAYGPQPGPHHLDHDVPPRWLWLFDVLLLIVAFPATRGVAELVQPAVLWSGALGVFDWLTILNPAAGEFPSLLDLLWIPPLTVPATMLVLSAAGAHQSLLTQSRARLVMSTLGAPLVALGMVALAVLTFKVEPPSRTFLLSYTATNVIGLLGYRALLRSYKRRRLGRGHYVKNVLVIGTASASAAVEQALHAVHGASAFRVVGYLGVEPARLDPVARAAPPQLGGVGALAELLIAQPIHDVLVVPPAASGSVWLNEVIETCDYFRAPLRIIPEALLLRSLGPVPQVYGSGLLRVPEIVLRPHELDSDAQFAKRIADVVLSFALLVLLLPLFAIVALAIKLTTPQLTVFYPWRVIGHRGQPFTGYKFTTMVADADTLKAHLMDRNEMSGPVFKIKDDPRITPVGRLLRKFSINELPQLWSVLRGDMSLVGPRPAGPEELKRYELWHKRKLSVRPGITCLWQVRGRNRISSFDDWVRLDFEYINNWSLWLDIKILLRTAWVVVRGTGS